MQKLYLRIKMNQNHMKNTNKTQNILANYVFVQYRIVVLFCIIKIFCHFMPLKLELYFYHFLCHLLFSKTEYGYNLHFLRWLLCQIFQKYTKKARTPLLFDVVSYYVQSYLLLDTLAELSLVQVQSSTKCPPGHFLCCRNSHQDIQHSHL